MGIRVKFNRAEFQSMIMELSCMNQIICQIYLQEWIFWWNCGKIANVIYHTESLNAMLRILVEIKYFNAVLQVNKLVFVEILGCATTLSLYNVNRSPNLL